MSSYKDQIVSLLPNHPLSNMFMSLNEHYYRRNLSCRRGQGPFSSLKVNEIFFQKVWELFNKRQKILIGNKTIDISSWRQSWTIQNFLIRKTYSIRHNMPPFFFKDSINTASPIRDKVSYTNISNGIRRYVSDTFLDFSKIQGLTTRYVEAAIFSILYESFFDIYNDKTPIGVFVYRGDAYHNNSLYKEGLNIKLMKAYCEKGYCRQHLKLHLKDGKITMLNKKNKLSMYSDTFGETRIVFTRGNRLCVFILKTSIDNSNREKNSFITKNDKEFGMNDQREFLLANKILEIMELTERDKSGKHINMILKNFQDNPDYWPFSDISCRFYLSANDHEPPRPPTYLLP